MLGGEAVYDGTRRRLRIVFDEGTGGWRDMDVYSILKHLLGGMMYVDIKPVVMTRMSGERDRAVLAVKSSAVRSSDIIKRS